MKMSEIFEVLSPSTYVGIMEVGNDREFERALIYPPIPLWRWNHGGYSEWYGYEIPAKKDLAEREIANIICLYDKKRGCPFLDIQIWSQEEKEG